MLRFISSSTNRIRCAAVERYPSSFLLHGRSATPSRHYAPASDKGEAMFCFQCEQTKRRTGCTVVGVCGKSPQVAALQDLLLYNLKGISVFAKRGLELGVAVPQHVDDFVFGALFSTLTNVNFDPGRFSDFIRDALKHREELKNAYEKACASAGVQPDTFVDGPSTWLPSGSVTDVESLAEQGKMHGVHSSLSTYGADVNGVREMIVYGLKGMCSYALHAVRLGQRDKEISHFVYKAFDFLESGPVEERKDLGTNLKLALKVGEVNLLVLSLLDAGHRKCYGDRTPVQVHDGPKVGKGILVSGHDIFDLHQILKATEDTGINVYTHGELLPAHGYPEIRKYKNLAGHYGRAWQLQKFEFSAFPGPIIITTNCMIEPLKSYKDRIFTLNETGFAGVKHLDVNNQNDMKLIIDTAKANKGFTKEDCRLPSKTLTVGFGHETILNNADKVLEAMNNGSLKRIFVVGGCDGSENKRNYYTELVKILPPETLMLTMGCAKYRFNTLEHGVLGQTGLPRLLDMGQCNDSYGAVVLAQALAGALKTDINSLPISIVLSWFEQKAVAVLLSLLHLGIKNIRLGPILPAFITPNVMDILAKNYSISSVDIKHPEDDLREMMALPV